MTQHLGIGCFLLSLSACSAGAAPPATTERRVEGVVRDIDGKDIELATFRGKAVLIVNVASECGFTPQYEELQTLQARYADRGLVVLAFPSNDFGGQEPADGAEIKRFAMETYGVTFPLFEKVHAKGDDIAPLYRLLTTQTRKDLRGPVQWNFTKFLVDPQGRVVGRFSSMTSPLSQELVAAVEAVLPAANGRSTAPAASSTTKPAPR